jgi:YD repeat-containing protein
MKIICCVLSFLYFLLVHVDSAQIDIVKQGEPLLRQIFIDSVLYSEFTYTTENRISEEKSKYFYTKYNYNDHNQIISFVSCEDPSIVSSDFHILEAGKLRKEWISPENSTNSRQKIVEYDALGQVIKMVELPGYSMFKYDSKNRICAQEIYRDEKLRRRMEYTYDRQGNLTEMCNYEIDEYGKPHLVTTNEYEFDNHKNPFRSFGITMMPGKYTNCNNIKQEVYTLHIMENEKQITKYVYEYNDEGYPVSVNKNMKYIYK